MLNSAIERPNAPSRSLGYQCLEARGPMLDRVYSMRYRSYSEEDYIEKCVSQKFMDEYDAKPNCTSYLLYSDNKAVASIRACIYAPGSAYDVPVMDVYRSEIENSIGWDGAFIEVNKFVVDPTFQKRGGLKARFNMFRQMTDLAFDIGAKSILIAVREEHVRFYGMLKCYPISNVKSYPHLNFKTVLLACTDLKLASDFISGKIGIKRVSDEPILNYSVN